MAFEFVPPPQSIYVMPYFNICPKKHKSALKLGNTMSNRSKSEQEESELKEQCMLGKSMVTPVTSKAQWNEGSAHEL